MYLECNQNALAEKSQRTLGVDSNIYIYLSDVFGSTSIKLLTTEYAYAGKYQSCFSPGLAGSNEFMKQNDYNSRELLTAK